MRERFDEFLEGITDKFETAKEEVSSYVSAGKSKAHEEKNEAANGKKQTS